MVSLVRSSALPYAPQVCSLFSWWFPMYWSSSFFLAKKSLFTWATNRYIGTCSYGRCIYAEAAEYVMVKHNLNVDHCVQDTEDHRIVQLGNYHLWTYSLLPSTDVDSFLHVHQTWARLYSQIRLWLQLHLRVGYDYNLGSGQITSGLKITKFWQGQVTITGNSIRLWVGYNYKVRL